MFNWQIPKNIINPIQDMSWFFKKKDKDKKDSEQKDNTGDISPRDEPSKSKPKALDPKYVVIIQLNQK